MGPKVKGNSNNSSNVRDGRNGEEHEEYQEKRARNNIAVKKSREKSRLKQRETLEKVNRLRSENQDLEMKVTLLSKELQVLRNLFLEHAGGTAGLPPQCEQIIKVEMEGKPSTKQQSTPPPVNAIAARKDHEYSSPKPYHMS